MVPPPIPEHLLDDLLKDFSFNTSAFIGKKLDIQLRNYTGPHFKLTNEQLITLTLNGTATEQRSGKMYWLKIECDSALFHMDHTWYDTEANEYWQFSHFERLKRCRVRFDRSGRIDRFGPLLDGLLVKIVVLPMDSEKLRWKEGYREEGIFQVFFIHQEVKVYLTCKDEWDDHAIWTNPKRTGFVTKAYRNPATLNTPESVDLSGEGAKTTLASNEVSNNVEILRKLDFALEKSVRLTRMRPEGERLKNGKFLVQ